MPGARVSPAVLRAVFMSHQGSSCALLQEGSFGERSPVRNGNARMRGSYTGSPVLGFEGINKDDYLCSILSAVRQIQTLVKKLSIKTVSCFGTINSLLSLRHDPLPCTCLIK